ncbi:MAG TPA: Lrp/AsnC family transcriptional regulator, partial [Actinophytocola sp.]|uniref:Lrp/AsnC family transcriptional regulator n=1 Tax=Actinophytocola sp. TaxID=1872138 RepID=UPI002DFC72A1|nr:Lrp/AsnC family transcriptional regulator [Actinophytocola sp.]
MSELASDLEPIDRAIARELSADGRCSFTDLAERVGLSVSAVHQRVRRLEHRGVIRGYSARLNVDAVGLPLTAFISLTPTDPGAPDDYPQRLESIREIE